MEQRFGEHTAMAKYEAQLDRILDKSYSYYTNVAARHVSMYIYSLCAAHITYSSTASFLHLDLSLDLSVTQK